MMLSWLAWKAGEDILTLESLREKLNSRFERITSKEREKDRNEKALAAGFNVQFNGTCCKCGEYGHKSDSPKCPENQGTDGIKNPRSGHSRGDLNESRHSNTKCCLVESLGIRYMIVLKVKSSTKWLIVHHFLQ